MTAIPIPSLMRLPLRGLSLARLFIGGRLNDAGRLPRYVAFFLVGATCIWAPITTYLKTAPARYTSHMSLILPGAGVSASVNLNNIGQASSFASSAFASNSVSPTETYKRLIAADRIVDAAAEMQAIPARAFGRPRVNLVDQTGLIHVEMVGNSPEDARARNTSILNAFFEEIDQLRADEQRTREDGAVGAIREYHSSVRQTRDAISALQTQTGLLTATQYATRVEANDRTRERLSQEDAKLQQKTHAVRMLETQLDIPAELAAVTLKLYADPDYMALLADCSDQAALLAAAQSRFGASHPKVTSAMSAKAACAQAAQMRAADVTGLSATDLSKLDLAPDGARAQLLAELVRQETERAGLDAQVSGIRRHLSAESATLAALAAPAARLEDLQRDFDVAEAVFASAIARQESAKSDVYASYPLVQVLENPSLPDSPTSPREKLAIAAGGAATILLLMALGMGWIRRAMITRLLSRPA